MADIKLLPCPFCGVEPKVIKYFNHKVCTLVHRCANVGPVTFTESLPILCTRWNTRKVKTQLRTTFEHWSQADFEDWFSFKRPGQADNPRNWTEYDIQIVRELLNRIKEG